MSSKIKYTISCTSSALELKSGVFNFSAKKAKPSEEIVKLLDDESYGLLNIFKGMRSSSSEKYARFLEKDDRTVEIGEKRGISAFDYLGYLVKCMVSVTDKSSGLKNSNYYWSVYDDINNEYGGSYFRVKKITANTQYTISHDTYELNIGYPSGEYITSFTVNNDSSWALLYDYSEEVAHSKYVHRIDNDGKMVETYSPKISSKTLTDNETNRTWWSQMTQFPIQAKVVVKGLLRPAMLMSYVKINSYFYGQKHVSS
jgi:hypothetical protein